MTDTATPATEVRRSSTIVLRYPQFEDGPAYLQLRRENEDHLAPWEPITPPGIDAFGRLAFAALLKNARTERRNGLLITHAHDDTILGAVNINEMVYGSFESAYLGYWLGAQHTGHGHMTRALRLAVDFAFLDLGLHRLEANIMPHNIPSLATIKRVGFSREGYSPRYLRIAGKWEDHERWALTREDWESSSVRQEG